MQQQIIRRTSAKISYGYLIFNEGIDVDTYRPVRFSFTIHVYHHLASHRDDDRPANHRVCDRLANHHAYEVGMEGKGGNVLVVAVGRDLSACKGRVGMEDTP